MEEKIYKTAIESILFTMGDSVELDKIAAALELDIGQTKCLIEELAQEYEESGRGMRIIELEGAYQMCTAPGAYDFLIRIAKQPKKHVLTDVLLRSFGIHSLEELPKMNALQIEEFKREAEIEVLDAL